MDKERFFINALKKYQVLKGIGDDGVILDSSLSAHNGYARVQGFAEMLIASDGFCEHIHFKREWLHLKDIAKKAMLVNISDILAMNATPLYATLSITLPKLANNALDEIAQGLSEVAKQYGVYFIGGDTMSGQNLAFHITLFGRLHQKPILRKGLRKNDVIFCTGILGGSQYALNWLLKGGKISRSRRFARFIAPRLRRDFIHKVAHFIHCGIDVSDGVYSELNRLCEINHCGIKLFKKDKNFASGEEYEFLFAIAPNDIKRVKALARILRVPLTPIGIAGRKRKRFKAKLWHK